MKCVSDAITSVMFDYKKQHIDKAYSLNSIIGIFRYGWGSCTRHN